MVEYLLPKQKVAGSNPVSRSIFCQRRSLPVLNRSIESDGRIQNLRLLIDAR